MDEHLSPYQPEVSAVAERHEAEVLQGILAHNPQVPPAQYAAMVQSLIGNGAHAVMPRPTAANTAAILLRPGVVQAGALGLNYSLVLGLDLSGVLQSSDVPAQAVLLGMNYLVLVGLMMSLSLLCLIHSFVRANVRPVYRALLVAMGTTGLFGMMESIAFSTSAQFAPLMLMLFVVTVPLISIFVALYSITRGLAQSAAPAYVPIPINSNRYDGTRLPPR